MVKKKITSTSLETPSSSSDSPFVVCPDCRAKINVEGGEVGDYFECETCFAEFTLSEIDPPKVELVDEEK